MVIIYYFKLRLYPHFFFPECSWLLFPFFNILQSHLIMYISIQRFFVTIIFTETGGISTFYNIFSNLELACCFFLLFLMFRIRQRRHVLHCFEMFIFLRNFFYCNIHVNWCFMYSLLNLFLTFSVKFSGSKNIEEPSVAEIIDAFYPLLYYCCFCNVFFLYFIFWF